ncbi:MAG: transposase [Armatimonadota bacterium]
MAYGCAPETGSDLASQPTLSRFEKSVSRAELYRMSQGQVFIDLFVEGDGQALDEIILDLVDTTDDPLHG